MTIKNVAIFGSTGRLGTFVLQALVDSKRYSITVLQRAESSTKIDSTRFPGVASKSLPADYVNKTDEVAEILKGQDALVSMMPSTYVQEHVAVATACCMANVQRFIPADFGSVSSDDEVCIELVPSFGLKRQVRRSLQEMSEKNSGFSWTTIITAHFLDYGLQEPLMGFDLTKSPPTAMIFDGGDIKWSATTRYRIGEAVAKVLSPEHEEQTRNKMIYIEGVNATQNETLAILEKVSGKKFDVKHVESPPYIKERKHELDAGTGHDPEEELVGVLGMLRSNWETQPNLMNKAFGFEPESLESVAREAWEKVGSK